MPRGPGPELDHDALAWGGAVINATTWSILIVSLLGLVVAVTPLGKTAGSSEVATLMLFVVIGQIASGSDFSAITQAPIYLLMGAIVLVFHAAVMIIYAKLTTTELFSLAVASTANVGGIASAPVVAAAFNMQLVPVGVLYALIGSFMGTFVGLTAARPDRGVRRGAAGTAGRVSGRSETAGRWSRRSAAAALDPVRRRVQAPGSTLCRYDQSVLPGTSVRRSTATAERAGSSVPSCSGVARTPCDSQPTASPSSPRASAVIR